MSIPSASSYLDLQGLSDLKSRARAAPSENLRETAAQFESIFFQMMLKSMRDATLDGGLFNSSQLDTYQQMFDQQLSLDLSRQGGLGLAEILVEQLGEQTISQRPEEGSRGDGAAGMTRLDIERQLKSLSAVDSPTAPAAAYRPAMPQPATAPEEVPVRNDWKPESPEISSTNP